MMSHAHLDVLTATADDVVRCLDSGELTAQDVVRIYLAQIERHNQAGLNLRAVISTNPESALAQAATLDAERSEGKLRSHLHGVPAIIKDNIQTGRELGMPTTAGAAVFKSSIAREDATIVRRLRQAGMVILGKASLTEFCGNKAHETTCGWSSVNGQTQSAWIEGGLRPGDTYWGRSTPGGSSSGSGVGVAAGFAPLSVGSETTGSLVLPANRAGLYGLKLSWEAAMLEGALPLCMAYDSFGGLARSAKDLEGLVKAMAGPRHIEVREVGWKDVRVGFTDPARYGGVPENPEDRDESQHQIVEEYEEAMATLRKLGAKVVYPVELIKLDELEHKGNNAPHPTSFVDVKEHWPEWIARMDNTPVKTFEELVEWNTAHPEKGMPTRESSPPLGSAVRQNVSIFEGGGLRAAHEDQEDLLEALNSTLTRADTDEIFDVCHPRARDSVTACLKDNDIDLIFGPADCALCVVASIAQCPNGVVPLGILNGPKGMGQPQGLMFMANRHEEGRMLEFMKLWNEHHGEWKVATRLRTLK